MALGTKQVRRFSASVLSVLVAMGLAGCATSSEEDSDERFYDDTWAAQILSWDVNVAVNGVPDGFDDFVQYEVERKDEPTTSLISAYRAQAEGEGHEEEWNKELVDLLFETEGMLGDLEAAEGASRVALRYLAWREDHEQQARTRPETLVDTYLDHLAEAGGEQEATDAEHIDHLVRRTPRTEW